MKPAPLTDMMPALLSGIPSWHPEIKYMNPTTERLLSNIYMMVCTFIYFYFLL